MVGVVSDGERFTQLRRGATLRAAKEAGLMGGQTRWIGGRLEEALVSAAKTCSGITSDTELLAYALARVALEDDFGGSI